MASRYYRRRRGDNGIVPLILIAAVAQAYGFTADMAARVLTYSTLVVTTCVIIYALVAMSKRLKGHHSLSNAGMSQIDTMSGLEFERYIAALLKKRGFTNVRLTERYDWGVDIIAHKDGIRWGVQTKRSSGLVKVAAVRQVVAGLNKYGCERSMVITNGVFSTQAVEIARCNNCILINRERLQALIIS